MGSNNLIDINSGILPNDIIKVSIAGIDDEKIAAKCENEVNTQAKKVGRLVERVEIGFLAEDYINNELTVKIFYKK